MKITPLDIQQKQFPVKFRGYDAEEVEAFLEVVKEEMEELVRENSSLREDVRQMEIKLKEYRDLETTMKGLLVSTQQMSDEYKVNVQKEAELIKREAELRANEIVKEAQDNVVKIHEDIAELKRIKKHFKEEVSRLIESHKKMIDFENEREKGADIEV